jgi:hypothetical protein
MNFPMYKGHTVHRATIGGGICPGHEILSRSMSHVFGGKEGLEIRMGLDEVQYHEGRYPTDHVGLRPNM